MRINILAKNVGIGNQFQFMPHALALAKNHDVTCDSDFFCELTGIKPMKSIKADWHIVVFGYDELKVWKARVTHRGQFMGFKYRIKGIHCGIGFDRGLRLDESISEVENNDRILRYFGIIRKEFSIDRQPSRPKDYILLCPSGKIGKELPIELWYNIVMQLESKGHQVKIVDNNIFNSHYQSTPTISDLADVIQGAKVFIGVDSGPMHLADILKVPMVVIFGPTSAVKNGPQNEAKIIKACGGNCYNWSRYKCPIDFRCYENIEAQDVIHEVERLIEYKKQSHIIA